MTTLKHTPGPWTIGVRQPTSDKFIYGPLGEEIADCDRLLNFPEENLANANLIAAAPELLAALEFTLAALYAPDCPTIPDGAMVKGKILNAIRKASGYESV